MSIEPEIIDVSGMLQHHYDDDEERRELEYAYTRYCQLYLYCMKRLHFDYSIVSPFWEPDYSGWECMDNEA